MHLLLEHGKIESEGHSFDVGEEGHTVSSEEPYWKMSDSNKAVDAFLFTLE